MSMAGKPRVLIVDDEERFRTTMGRLLGVRGLDVFTVGSAAEALDEIRKSPYDVIVLDVRMPGMSGIEALAEIKRIRPGVEVIILTGHASVDTAVEIMRLGGYEYLLKPCPIDELVDKVEAAYERKMSREKGRRTPPDGSPGEPR
jgi:DNA-binding NtrC family response regulator